MNIIIKKIHEENKCEKSSVNNPEYNLNLLELLRLESGKFLYEYPARFRRVFKVIRKK